MTLYTYILIILDLISICNSKISPIFPLYKFLLSENINNLDSNSDKIFNHFCNIKGNGIVFNNEINVNIMPINLFSEIFNFFYITYEEILMVEMKNKDDYKEMIFYSFYNTFETVNFILEDICITIPIKDLFIKNKKKNYTFRFIGKENEDNIVLGKDLIELMNIEFIGNDNFIIHNKDFIAKFDDDNNN